MSMDRVLITRPEPAAHKTAAKLKKLGFEPVLVPLFKTVFLQSSVKLNAEEYAALVFSSRNAVAAIKADMNECAPEKVLPIYVVGRATAEAATAAGFRDVRIGMGTGRELAQLIAQDQAGGVLRVSPERPVLYLAGAERKPDFEVELWKSDIAVVISEIYRMDKISYSTDFLNSDILSPFPRFVLLYSANAARRFVEIFMTQTSVLADISVTAVCLSRQVAHVLPEALQRNARIANAPNEEELLESLSAIR